ncbi:MAG: HTH domain-containing protein [Candidatus Scalindua sp. AMX11]|nr:MAG: HTH domain-containing protein [Candidatus Scalindua sp.]NOG83334.1 HTH domain-containing protein [Planctomycetota bacterium]RZV76766.1 MAG: HTH domain-containing protein [Candidatus Scalindua sp. SCAELEC01]TDE63950.1 MAG: HTH domain-containing protein [Candidatus Scalindua sp. AMX11]GJQ60250.1 MAG: hypothetical protein SCALA701_30510 [Candidatus Scalindua sp.]
MNNSIINSNNPTKLISQKKFAEMLGVSRTAIWQHIQKGNITLTNGKIDPERAKEELASNIDLTHGRSKVLIASKDIEIEQDQRQYDTIRFRDAKAKREHYRAKLAELEYNEKAGIFVIAKEVRDANETLYRVFRDRFLNIPSRISGQLATETEQQKVHYLLDNEIKKAIEVGF